MSKEINSENLMNLDEALEEFELNHLLATTLICGRIIIYNLDSISPNINDVVTKMKTVGMLKPKGAVEDILKTNKKARGLFAHDLNYFPDPSEALAIFGDTVNIVKRITEYKGLSLNAPKPHSSCVLSIPEHTIDRYGEKAI